MTAQDSSHAAHSTSTTPRSIDRRSVLRGAGIVAGVAGATAVGAVTATPAAAADGQPVIVGDSHASQSTTEIIIDHVDPGVVGHPDPALRLVNVDGPALHLNPLHPEWSGELQVGDIVNTDLGPLIGVQAVGGPTPTYLATAIDLEDLPTPFVVRPVRLIDTRIAADRASVLAHSPAAFDADGRLRAGAWIDVKVSPAVGDFIITAAHVNVTATLPTGWGYLSVYAGGDDYPGTSTLNFQPGLDLANAAFTPVGVVLGQYAIRIRTTTPVHVVLDFSGGAVRGRSALPTTSEDAVRRTQARAALVTKVQNAVSR